MCDLFESGHEHSREAYAREPVDRAYRFLVACDWNLELIPFDLLGVSVAGHDDTRLFVGYEVLADNEVFGADRYMILEIALIFVESVVLVDILDVGQRA